MNALQQAFVKGFVKRAAQHGVDQNKALNLYKKAYGVYSDGMESARWYDGGPMWSDELNKKFNFSESPKHVAAMTKAFAEAAKRQKADLQFSGADYDDDIVTMTPEEAIKKINNKKILDLDDPDLPHFYDLKYPLKERKGFLETLRLRDPKPIDKWPEGHPLDLAVKEYNKYL